MRKLRHRIRKHLAQGQLAETLEFSAVITITLSLWLFDKGSGDPRAVVDPGVSQARRARDPSHIWKAGRIKGIEAARPVWHQNWHDPSPQIISRKIFRLQSWNRAQRCAHWGWRQRVLGGDKGAAPNHSLLGLAHPDHLLCWRPQGDIGGFKAGSFYQATKMDSGWFRKKIS